MAFLGQLEGNLADFSANFLLIFTFGPVTGGHPNPFVTSAAYCCLLTTFSWLASYVVADRGHHTGRVVGQGFSEWHGVEGGREVL